MPLIYALVARGQIILAEHTLENVSINMTGPTQKLLKQLSQSINQSKSTNELEQSILHVDSRRSFRHSENDAYVYHIDENDGFVFLCLTDVRFSKHIAYQFLSIVKQKFEIRFGKRSINQPIAYQFQLDFERILDSEMKLINQSVNQSDGPDAKITQIRGHVTDVKENMVKNLDRVLDRGENIDRLIDLTQELDTSTARFDRSTNHAKIQMRKKWCKWTIIALLTIAIIIVALLMIICGPKINQCG